MPSDFGPVLLFRGLQEGRVQLAALFGRSEGAPRATLRSDLGEGVYTELFRQDGFRVGRVDFSLPCDAAPACYTVDGREIEVHTRFHGDLKLAFASCNGQEHVDFDRPEAVRNAMWAQLGAEHRRAPFSLLLHGGGQIYADDDVRCHPLTQGWPQSLPREVTADQLLEVERALRRAFVARYSRLYASAGVAGVCMRVPSLAMWDDHDICDGWGSLERSRTRSAIGQAVFRVAREMFLLFQHGATETDVPGLFADPDGAALGWHHRFPGFEIIAPDLRSERGRRQVMGPRGWAMLEALREGPAQEHVFLISSVPLLGPRLSLCLDVLERSSMTVLSGEIHLAAQARMKGRTRDLIQLIASGIAHDAPPQGYARALGLLAGLGEAPLKRHPIRIEPLPGQSQRYVAERNYLVLTRSSGEWSAEWELEQSGRTPPMSL
jgi:hypothetical protein